MGVNCLINIGQYCKIDDGVVFINNNVRIDNFVTIMKGCKIGHNVHIGNYCELRENVVVGNHSELQGRLRIADNCVIGGDVILKYGSIFTGNTRIGDGCFIGPHVIVLGADHKRNVVQGTVIGADCYIGGGVKILPGVQIAPCTIIGTSAVVTKDIMISGGVYVGIPAKFQRQALPEDFKNERNT